MELAINPSKIISPLCYSVLRLEPYTNCAYSCLYCYARWYRGGRIKPRPRAIGMFAKVAKKLDLRIPFRLSTLSDPLQDIEENARVSYKLMKIAMDNGIPVILSTKSDRIAKNPWKSLIEEMAKDGSIVVQVSICSLDRNELEHRAPPPQSRIKALENIDAPKLLRLQPLIPNYSFADAEEFVEMVKDVADQITTEPLRIERGEIDFYGRFWNRWSHYSFEGELLKADCYEILESLSSACRKYGLDFGLCKEGYFHLETANCCGLHMIECELRPTLREVYRLLLERREIHVDELKFEGYLFGERLNELPRAIRKALRFHEKLFLKCLKDNSCLSHLTPLIRFEDGKLTLSGFKYQSNQTDD